MDACETARAETLAGNALLPLTIANACLAAKIPWGHVSSGCERAKVTCSFCGPLRPIRRRWPACVTYARVRRTAGGRDDEHPFMVVAIPHETLDGERARAIREALRERA